MPTIALEGLTSETTVPFPSCRSARTTPSFPGGTTTVTRFALLRRGGGRYDERVERLAPAVDAVIVDVVIWSVSFGITSDIVTSNRCRSYSSVRGVSFSSEETLASDESLLSSAARFTIAFVVEAQLSLLDGVPLFDFPTCGEDRLDADVRLFDDRLRLPVSLVLDDWRDFEETPERFDL
jgi:hypothetical protein